jgi:hypothetical protein
LIASVDGWKNRTLDEIEIRLIVTPLKMKAMSYVVTLMVILVLVVAWLATDLIFHLGRPLARNIISKANKDRS